MSMTSIGKSIVYLRMALRVIRIAFETYGSIPEVIRVSRKFRDLRAQVYGRNDKRKYQRRNGKYYFSLYVPAYPSPEFDNYVRYTLNRFIPTRGYAPQYSHLLVAITSKCPLRCEHCFEWNNLQKPEPFALSEWMEILAYYQRKGVCSIHFSGGEPMVRLNDLLSMIAFAKNSSDSWVLSSGFNVTKENARLLKEAGTIGMIVSLDDVLPDKHESFRGYSGAYAMAIDALHHAREAGLVTAMSICTTRAFLDRPGSLDAYAELGKELGVAFIQLFEPKPVGHYAGKDVLLYENHLRQLEAFMFKVNYDKAYAQYPIVIYHGHYQRKSGCAQGSDQNLYIDSAGNVHACPFCQTADYNLKDLLRGNTVPPEKVSACPAYKTLN